MAKKLYGLTKADRDAVADVVKRVGGGNATRRSPALRRRVLGTSSNRQDELRGTVDSYIAAGTAGNTYGTIVLKTSPAPINLPTGTPGLTGTIYVADIHAVGSFAANDVVRAIRNVAVDSYNPGGGAVDVDWEHLPTSSSTPIRVVTVYHSTLGNGESVDPVHANLPRIFGGTLTTSDDIWIESLDTHKNSDIRSWLPAGGKFLGLEAGVYNPDDDESEATDEERPLYKIQPQHPGTVLGMVEGYGSDAAADWTTTTAPDVGTVRVTLYNYTEAGALEVFDTGVDVTYMAESDTPEAGTIVYVSLFEGRWHITSQLCAIASGYSA